MIAFELATHVTPLPRPIVTARGPWTSRESLVLTLRDRFGQVGRGEASPLPNYSRDDAAACRTALANALGKLDVPPPEEDAWDWLTRVLAPFEGSLADLPSARFALETALVDLGARRMGLSVAEWLAGGRSLAPIARSGLVDLASPELEEDARALVSREIRTLKAKMGARPLAHDLDALARLHAAVGEEVTLRLDANGGFRRDPRAALEALAPFAPELVEEPTDGEALASLGPCAVPWAADESLQDARVARALLESSSCAAIVVKPALYGLRGARTLALAAAARGKRVIFTHLFDGPIAVAAACELALALAPRVPLLACGLDMLWEGVHIPQLQRPGLVAPQTRDVGAGLGVP
jgi:L-alanine-DL-glutamate epimerase-like enolase superfamily enzyme